MYYIHLSIDLSIYLSIYPSIYLYEHNVCSVTSDAAIADVVPSFKDSSALLSNCEMNLTKVKSF